MNEKENNKMARKFGKKNQENLRTNQGGADSNNLKVHPPHPHPFNSTFFFPEKGWEKR